MRKIGGNGSIWPMRRLNLNDIANFLGLEVKDSSEVTMYAIDSRLVQPSGLFFALKGARVDGHDFAKEAKQNGAIAIIASQAIDIEGIGVLYVPDVRQALQDLAGWVFTQKACTVIGVTGSLGKTSTKECIAQGLGDALKVGFSPGSYNSQVTLPLAVLNCPEDADVCVLEYAMSKKSQMERLVKIAPPDIGVMTPIDYAHAENFESVQEIAEEKAELFRSPVMKQGFVHYKSWDFVQDVGTFPKEEYGKDAKGPFASLALNENYAAAMAIGRYLGIEQLAKVKPVDRRFEIVERSGMTIVNDSYNANVTSFKAAMENLPEGKRMIGVLGSMGELGKFAKSCHLEVAKEADKIFDQILYIGKDWQAVIKENKHLYPSFDKLKKAFLQTILPGDVVLIKGANYHELWRLLELI